MHHQAHNRRGEDRYHQRAENAQRHRAAAVEAKDHCNEQEHRSREPIAPADQSLYKIREEKNERALIHKIADADEERKEQGQHRA